MKTLRTLLASALLLMSGAALADDYQYLTIAQTGGETSYAVADIQKITFDATDMVLHLSNGTTQSLPLAQLSKMFFSAEQTGIQTISGDTQSKIHFADGVLRATVAPGERVTLFNVKGEQVFTSTESGTFDLSTLVKGVYIVKIGSETKKVVNK